MAMRVMCEAISPCNNVIYVCVISPFDATVDIPSGSFILFNPHPAPPETYDAFPPPPRKSEPAPTGAGVDNQNAPGLCLAWQT